MKHFLKMKDNERFLQIVSSFRCLVTFADAESNTNAVELIGIINDLKVKEKYLNVKMAFGIDLNMLKNLSINFSVMVQHLSSCVYDLYKFSIRLNSIVSTFPGNVSRTTYLCPELGKSYPVIHNIKCHPNMRSPNGKTLPISFIGIVPYIKQNPFGGSENLVIKMLAMKYGFLPRFIPEKTFDVTMANGTTFGMVHRVR